MKEAEQTTPSATTAAICCGYFEKYASSLGWMHFTDDDEQKIRVMPHINANGSRWRVNNCPTCGFEVRGIQVTEEQFKNFEDL
jgi:hypothetical protein